MTIIVPLVVLAVASLAVAVYTGVRASSPDAGPAQRSGLWVMTTILVIVGVAAGLAAWWAWRFSETFTF
jgi:heme/copper-type cytochrome/quinol oxidase subunit 2